MTTETKFTPGPWEIKKSPFEVYNVDHGALTHQVDSGQTMLAALYVHHESHDARLIAAAPELLEALQKMVEMASSGMVDFNPHDEFVMSSARSAIAKARGES